MRRPVQLSQVVIGTGPSVFVADHHGDRGASCESIGNSRQNLDLVRLVALGCQTALAGSTPIELMLDAVDVYGQTRRYSVDDNADSTPVALTKGRQSKMEAEGVTHSVKA